MTDTLAEICDVKRNHIAACKQQTSETQLLEIAKQVSAPRGFKRALKDKLQQGRFGLIAEIKKASPSKGIIRNNFDPARLARSYADGGAACLSVLTDMPYFMGHDNNLRLARETVALPILRKDFMLDPYQIVESRALGADCILLIMAALSDAQASELEACAIGMGMDVLVEVHNEQEMERALTHLKSTLIGINNRDLKTLKVDITTSETLAKKLPSHMLPVCESGIRTNAELIRMQQVGISCFLVGESLMREEDVTLATKKLLGLNDD